MHSILSAVVWIIAVHALAGLVGLVLGIFARGLMTFALVEKIYKKIERFGK